MMKNNLTRLKLYFRKGQFPLLSSINTSEIIHAFCLLLMRKNVSFSVYFHVVIQFKNCCPQYAFPSYVHHKPSQLSRLISLNCQSLTANAARWRPRILSMLERDRKLGSLSLSRQQPLEVVLFRRADFLSTSNIEKNFPHLHSSSCLYVCKNETREDFKNAHIWGAKVVYSDYLT